MSLTEYNEKEFIENRKAEGRAEGKVITVLNLVNKGKLTPEEGAEELEVTIAGLVKLAEEYKIEIPCMT